LVIEAVAPDRRLCSAVIHDLDAVTAIVYDLSAGLLTADAAYTVDHWNEKAMPVF
jgi:hypothetical protein